MSNMVRFAPVSHDKVVETFEILLDGFSFEREMKLLDVGRLHVFRRRNVLTEYKALCVALWGLALERSFPEEHSVILDTYLAQLNDQGKSRKTKAMPRELILAYIELLATHKENDFTVVGEHMVALFNVDEKKRASLRLQLALEIRKLYSIIFDNLIAH